VSAANQPIPVAVHGAEGRMGRLVTRLVADEPDLKLVGLITEPGRSQPVGDFHAKLPLLGQDQMADHLPPGCVVIDFSLAPALEGFLDQSGRLGCPLVSGTTGYTEQQWQQLRDYSSRKPVVHANNYSVGIPALQMLLQLLARTLPASFDAEQVETHHITKLDKPSGTAAHLARAFGEIRGGENVPTHSQRLGGVIGEHTWTFSDQEETLVLTHRAHSRQAFTRGILPSVRHVATKDAGYFNLMDVLQEMGGRG